MCNSGHQRGENNATGSEVLDSLVLLVCYLVQGARRLLLSAVEALVCGRRQGVSHPGADGSTVTCCNYPYRGEALAGHPPICSKIP